MESILFQSGTVSASLQVFLDRFTTLVQKELGFILDADNERKKLERTLLKVQALVDNVRTMQHHSCSHKDQQLWLRDLQSVIHEADDLLDEIALEILKLSSNNANVDFINEDQVRNLVFSGFKFSIPSEIVEMQQKLEHMAREMDGFFIDEVVKLRQPNSIGKLQTSSLVDESCIIGRGKDKDEVLRLLLGEETERQDISVIAIVGMAGAGKTTLAQLVYNDVNVVDKFDLRIWVSISVEYTVERITKSIVECASGVMLELSDLDPIQMRLQEILKGKRFLIVLDGMWNEKANDWDVLCLPFKVAVQGSRILVTTRSMLVSRIVATAPAYHVQTLSDEDCWKLIKERAFSSMNQDEHKILVEIGLKQQQQQQSSLFPLGGVGYMDQTTPLCPIMNQVFRKAIGLKIARKCEGLPLQARMLGSALRFKSDEMEWDTILKSKILNSKKMIWSNCGCQKGLFNQKE